MNIHLNGENRDVPEGLSVMELVRHLGLEPGWVVVEHNVVALDRSLWHATTISDGDQIELVRFMGGG